MTTYECIWYNGEGSCGGCYELLDFDPNKILKGKLSKKGVEKVKAKAWNFLKKKYQLTDRLNTLESVYLLNVDLLVRLG